MNRFPSNNFEIIIDFSKVENRIGISNNSKVESYFIKYQNQVQHSRVGF